MGDFSALTSLQLISKDGKTIVPALINVFGNFQQKISAMFTELRSELLSIVQVNSEKIYSLENEVTGLRKTVSKLEEKLDEQSAFERRDTIIISGKKVPQYAIGENCASKVVDCLKENLKLVVSTNDIAVAHRLGSKPKNQTADHRSILVKLCRRDLKYNIVKSARVSKVKDLFVNESLTPQR